MRKWSFSWFLAMVLSGCGPQGLAPDFESSLTHRSGCGDVVFFAVDDADEVMLTLEASGLVEQAQLTGEVTVVEFQLPDPSLVLKVQVGEKVSDATCDDVIENGGPVIAQTYLAASGVASIKVSPEGQDGGGATASVTLEDVVFEAEGEESVTLESFGIEDISVGWLPG